ncbi:MAG: AAA family ATPase [Myxococcota bacterium]|nr:AAA family ATPase [Myxococcota bacterium]
MKLISVCGENLASLTSFELALDDEAFSQSGVFAITGPTGSGKSTILDAICLAIYGKTPRFDDRRGMLLTEGGRIGRKGLSSYDPVLLLSHGQVSAFSEVEFIGVEDKRYRARWSVHRARNKPDGQYQRPEHEFQVFDSGDWQRVGERKGDQSKIAAQLVGLDFENFCRSVFLAQGQFDAFLRADEEKRRDLLERMTGTEIYRSLALGARRESLRANARHEECRSAQRLKELLSEKERQEIFNRRERLLAEEQTLQREVDQQRTKISLLERISSLLKREQEAAQALKEDHRASQERAAERAQVRMWEQLSHLLPFVEQERRFLEQAPQLQEERAQHQRRLEETSTTLEALNTQRQALERQRDQLQRELPELDTLREQLAQAQRTLNEAKEFSKSRLEILRERERTLEGERKKAAERAEKQSALRESLEGHESWLNAHPHSALLAEDESVWDQALRRWLDAAQQLQELSHDETATKELSELERMIEGALAQREQARLTLEEHQNQLEALPAVIGEERWSWLDAALRAQGQFSRLLEQLFTAQDTHQRASQALQEVERQLDKREAQIESLRAALREAEREVEEAHRGHEEKSRAFERTEAGFSLLRYRELLEEDEPCPLCGALEHPGAEVDAAEESALLLLREAREASAMALKERERALQTINSDLGTTRGGLEEARLRQRERTEEREEQHARLHSLLEKIEKLHKQRVNLFTAAAVGEARGALEESLIPLDAFLGESFRAARAGYQLDPKLRTSCQAASADAHQALETLQKSWRLQIEQRQSAAQRVEKSQRAVTQTEDQIARYRREREKVRERLEATRAQRRPLEEGMEDAARRLERFEESSKRGGLLLEALSDGASVQRRGRLWEELAQQWRLRSEERAKILETLSTQQGEDDGARLVTLEVKVEHDREQLEEAQTRQLKAHEECREREEELDTLQSKERALRSLLSRLSEAKEEGERLSSRRRETEQAIAGLDAKVQLGEAQLTELRGTITRLLEEAKLDRDALHACPAPERLAQELERLREDEEVLESMRQRLRSLQLMRAEEEEKATELSLKYQPLAEKPAYQEEIDQLSNRLVEEGEVLETKLDAWNQSHQQLRGDAERLKQDEEARAQAGAFAEELHAVEQEALRWEALDQLIGAKEKNRRQAFRDFAQSLTLEQVLLRSNEHLHTLCPRYQLERIPNSALHLQLVDREMGDEARSIQGLSGGESFLVSLALALGLSSLSSRDVRIESLFIDEGFCTLDPESLEAVLTVLDNLQSSGRQVGIISHVSHLSERVSAEIQIVPEGSGRSVVRQRTLGPPEPQLFEAKPVIQEAESTQ